MRNFILAVLLFFSYTIHSQSLTISNDLITKRIDATSYLELKFGKLDGSGKNCCDYYRVSGSLSKVTTDSISLNIRTFHRYQFYNNIASENILISDDIFKNGMFAKDDLLQLTRYRSEKGKKSKRTFGTIGGLLIIAGVGTLSSVFIANGSKSKFRLLSAGGIQVGIGLVLGFSSVPKKYNFKGTEQPQFVIK